MNPNDRKQNPDSGDREPNHRERRRIEYGPPGDSDRRMSGRSTADDRQDPGSRNAAQQSWSGGDERKRTSG